MFSTRPSVVGPNEILVWFKYSGPAHGLASAINMVMEDSQRRGYRSPALG